RGIAARQPLRIGRKARQRRLPPRRQLVLLDLLELTREIRIFRPIPPEHLQPRGMSSGAALAEILGEYIIHPVRHQELRILRPAVETLGKPYLFFAERLAM